MNSLRVPISLIGAASALVIVLAGCTPAASPAGAGSPTNPAKNPPTSAAPAHAQGKFDGVPKHCLSADDVTLSIHESVPKLNESDYSPSLNCTYYTDGSTTSPVVNITFVPLNGLTVSAWSDAVKAQSPNAKSIPGVGDGAFVFTNLPSVPSGISFVSNGVECTAYTANFTADQTRLVTLAESILEG